MMRNPTAIRPTNITLDKTAGVLVIDWPDGQKCRYPLPQLREACPCVECRGGHENMGRAGDPDDLLALTLTPTRSYRVESAALVGNYALQFFWDDGHHTGIYTWEYLKRLCPVPQSETSANG
ncbi:MAG: gamma-butyrobetaine hydroxylase-like domain-containing protein [Aggregatilineales bacterium]